MSRTNRFLTSLIIFISSLFLLSRQTLAIALPTEPTFPSCLNPQGILLINYPEGTHGIIGDPIGRTGSDKVYRINDFTLTQCFCSTNGEGIQTNWWKSGSLDQSQIDTLKNLGWYFVPDGSLWGLEKSYYLAKNSNYSCSSGNNSSSSDNGIGGGGEVLSTSTDRTGQVLGLATTGNLDLALFYIFAGISFLILSRKLNRKS